MKVIATDVNDNVARMKEMVAEQQKKSGVAADPYFYRSHVTYEQELSNIIFKSWLYAGHISQVPNNGDYFLMDIGEDSIIVSRDQNGEIQSQHNICRHRGARVCEEPSGNRKTFVCPYHGWVYNTDGSLKAARHMDALEGFDCSDYNLKKVKVNVYKGMIFINCDINAEEFLPSLQKLDIPFSGYHMENAKIAQKKTYKVDANWKLVLENYLECYHCATSHRQYAKMHTLKDLACNTDSLNQAMHERSAEATGIDGVANEVWAIYDDAPHFGGCVYTSRYALYDGFKTGSQDGQPVAPLMGDFKGYDGGVGDYQMGPLTFMLNYPDHCVLYRFVPRGLTETDMEIIWFVNGDAEEGADYNPEKVSWLWHHTTLEDEFIIMRNSAGVNSRFFEPGPYHPEFEEISMQFVAWYLDALAR